MFIVRLHSTKCASPSISPPMLHYRRADGTSTHLPSTLSACRSPRACAGSFCYANVYYAGSHEGCGCGFSKDGRDSQELEQCQQNYRSLAGVLSSAVRGGARVQLFTCWEGKQTADPETTGIIAVEQLVEPEFELQQLSLLAVRRGA
jgi:hypothetical protein